MTIESTPTPEAAEQAAEQPAPPTTGIAEPQARRIVTIAMLKERAEALKVQTVEHYEPELDACFLIRPITWTDLINIRLLARGDEPELVHRIVEAGTVEPPIKRAEWGVLMQQTPGVPGRLAGAINALSGMGSDAAADAAKSV